MRFLLDHDVADDIELREVLPATTPDQEILRLAGERDAILITCNRDDFLSLAGEAQHAGLIILIRRRTRAQERAALVRLLDKAEESGLRGNINFA